MRFYRFLLCLFLTVALLPMPCKADDTNNQWPAAEEQEQEIQPGISYILRGEKLARSGDPFAAIVEYRKAIAAGYNNSDVFRSLSTVLYLAGFIDEATETLEEAVRLHPKEVFPRQELGVLYFASGNIDKAKESFLTVATENPTLANTFYYLGVIALQQQDFDEAWLYVRRAQLLGNQDHSLLDKLLERGNEPLIDQRDPIGNDLCFRQILLPSFPEAEKSLDRLNDGEMFEVVASTASTGPSANNGGFVGCLYPDELNSTLAASLWQYKAYAKPTIVETDRGAHIIQRVQPFNPELWRIQIAAFKRPKPKLSEAIIKQGLSPKELTRFVVHAGTYNGPILAASMVSRLRYAKFPAYFYTSPAPDKNGKLIYHVVAGRYPGAADAEAIRKRVENLGIGSTVVDTEQENIVQPEKSMTVASDLAPADVEITDETQFNAGKQNQAQPDDETTLAEASDTANVEIADNKEVDADEQNLTQTNNETTLTKVSDTANVEIADNKNVDADEQNLAQPTNKTILAKVSDPTKGQAVNKQAVNSAQPKHNNEVMATAVPTGNQNIPKTKTIAAVKPKKTTTAKTRKTTTNKDILAARAKAASRHQAKRNIGKQTSISSELPLIIATEKNEPVGKYTLHAGTSNNQSKTEAIVTRMREAGLPAFAYLSKTKNGKQVYRLAGGRFNTMKEANAAHKQLSLLGINTFIANTK